MKSQKQKFKYGKSHKIINWGCTFDSLTELKFAISIMEDYEFMRARVSIYYHPGTKLPTDYIRECHRHYTPDFLIRHKETGEAFLVEIKPRAFEHDPQLSLRKEVAENYIRWKSYDWKYKVIFDDEIILTVEQWEDFEECCKLKSKSSFKLWFEEYNKKFDRSAPSFFSKVPTSSDLHFIMFGKRSTRHEFNSKIN